MDLKNIWINNLAKAKNDFEFCCPPSKDGGNLDGGNLDGGNLDGGNLDGGNLKAGNSKAGGNLNRNVALAHSIKYTKPKLALAK